MELFQPALGQFMLPNVIADYLKNKMEEFTSITGTIGFDEIGDRVGSSSHLYVVNEDGSSSLIDTE